MLAGIQAAHTWRNEEDIPNVLLPNINKAGTVNPINGPATYHDQGCLKNANIVLNYLYRKNVLIKVDAV